MIDIANIPNVAAKFSFDMAGFAGLLLIVLADIFKYGNHLQDEYDATI